MQELNAFARKYHIQIVPLVQGLGHVSYILKHPQHKHLREVESLRHLEQARDMVREHLADRESVFKNLIEIWERTRLPKGYSTSEKNMYFHQTGRGTSQTGRRICAILSWMRTCWI